jgi:hypothetical protein
VSTDYRTPAEKDIAARFPAAVAKHELTILHDDGLYRHLHFAAPDGSGYRFDLITWPNKLVFTGEVGTYVFSVWPTVDMFNLFRESSVGDQPNFGYWHEKLRARDEDAVQFSDALFDKQVARELAEGEENWPGVTEAWTAKTEGFLAEYSTDGEQAARYAAHDFSFLPEDSDSPDAPFAFSDNNRWELNDWDWRYLWACYGALWGIAQYDAAKATTAEAVTA